MHLLTTSEPNAPTIHSASETSSHGLNAGRVERVFEPHAVQRQRQCGQHGGELPRRSARRSRSTACSPRAARAPARHAQANAPKKVAGDEEDGARAHERPRQAHVCDADHDVRNRDGEEQRGRLRRCMRQRRSPRAKASARGRAPAKVHSRPARPLRSAVQSERLHRARRPALSGEVCSLPSSALLIYECTGFHFAHQKLIRLPISALSGVRLDVC